MLRMDELHSRFNSYLVYKGRSLATRIVFFISVLLLVSSLSEYLLLRYDDRNWETVVQHTATENLEKAIQAFSGIQRETRRVATEVAQNPIVLGVLTDPGFDRSEVFELAAKINREHGVGVEVYNQHAQLVAWDGSSEPSHPREIQIALAGQLASFVTRSQVFSQLFVVTPVRSQSRILGAVLIRRTTELNYPLNNRIIVNTGVAEQLSEDLGVNVEYNFSPDAALNKDGRYISAPLIGIDSSKVGTVSVERPPRSAYLERVTTTFHTVDAALWMVLIGILSLWAGARLAHIESVLVRALAVTVLIWTVRYVLVWFDLPSAVFQIGIFDPKLFASKFGNGLAKSVGELFLTSVALFANTVVVGRYALTRNRVGSPSWYPQNGIIRWAIVPIAATMVFLLLRGYAATIRSAVYDSTLRFNNPLVIVPSFELAVMVMSLFFLSFCLVSAVVGLSSFAYTMLAGTHGDRKRVPWFMLAAIFAATAIVISFIPSDPLVSLSYRFVFAAATLGFTYYLHNWNVHGRSIITPRNILLTFALSAVFFHPILNDYVHERDRDRIEAYAQEVVKPTDSWLKFIVDEALQSFTSEETVNTLVGGDIDAVDRLAFDHWARSTAAREGYSCILAVSDTSGSELSRFVIGGQSTLDMYHALQNDRPGEKSIALASSGAGVNALRIYSGSIPIKTNDGEVIAYAHVVVAAGQQSLFRGESPSVLRSESQGAIDPYYRPITLSEFHDNRLLSSSSSLLPLGYEVPEGVQTQLADPKLSSLWADERIDDQPYETFYIKRPSASGAVLALSVPQLGFVWHLIGIVKLIVYYAILVLVLASVFLSVRWAGGHRYRFTFRDKLLGALLVTALVPIIVMATYGRQLARERMLDATSKRLEQETATLGVSISQRLQGEEGIVQEALSRYVIDQLADEAGTDFNLYVGDQLQASSRPELYDVGILDKRLSGLAYANTMLKGKRFYLQTENIGSYQYVVGYRPLVTDDGRIVGIVAVPTLYRFEEVEEEVARRNALIFGLYGVVVFLIVLIATTFANRIAAPIHRLTLATKKIARGELNVTVGAQNADGEIGELIQSFELMTKELARSREELVRAERELAWKEMAKQVAHEIKNPLTPMKLSIQHLRQTYKDKVPNFEQVFDQVSRTIIEQIDTLSRIAGEFARFGRMPKPSMESVEVNEVVRESVALFDQDANVEFDMLLEEHLPPVQSDREELRRAFINIIRNGIQAMNNTGRMTIRSWTQAGTIKIAFRDYGAGMSDEVKAKLFQPNFSTKTDGMGLGLAITKKSIDDVGGSIGAESVVGEGTTVTVSLPIERQEQAVSS